MEDITIQLEKANHKLRVAIKALNDIKDWDDDMEDEFNDPGYRAIEALKKISMIDCE